MIFYFNILPLEKEDIPSPKELADSLSEKHEMIKSWIKNFDDTYRIESSEYLLIFPKYEKNPEIINKSYNYISIEFRYDNYGYIYGVALDE